MKKKVIILFLGAIGLYVYFINKQMNDIKAVCSLYPVGASMEGIEDVAKRYSIKYMGSFEVNDNPGAMSVIFCAPLTMCDVSCNLVYKNNKIIRSDIFNN